MTDNAQLLRTGIVIDEATTRRAKRVLQDFARSQQSIEQESKGANRELNKQASALTDVDRSLRRVGNNDGLKVVTDDAKRAQTEIRKLDDITRQANDRFDETLPPGWGLLVTCNRILVLRVVF